MKDFNINLPRNTGIAIIAIAVIFSLSGYILYFGARSSVSEKQKEFDILKDKAQHTEDNYNELKKQLEIIQDAHKQLSKDHENLVQKQQECKMDLEEEQSKSGDLKQIYDRCKNDLIELQNKNNAASPTNTAPNTEKLPDAVPDKKKEGESSNDNGVSPISSTSSTIKTVALLNCPTSQEVTTNAQAGQWSQEKLKWWVDFSSRPLNTDEGVKDLYKVLYDGSSVACYYGIGDDSHSAWIVVKGMYNNNQPIKVNTDGWAPCPTDECKYICEKDNIGKCHFSDASTL